MSETKLSGRKDDAGKPLAGILYEDFPTALQQVISVATFGAKKYARGNWKDVADAEVRYWDAMHRHLLAFCSGPGIDEESGESHLAHAAWCLLALMELPRIGQKGMGTDVYLDDAPSVALGDMFRAEADGKSAYGKHVEGAITRLLRLLRPTATLHSYRPLFDDGMYHVQYTFEEEVAAYSINVKVTAITEEKQNG